MKKTKNQKLLARILATTLVINSLAPLPLSVTFAAETMVSDTQSETTTTVEEPTVTSEPYWTKKADGSERTSEELKKLNYQDYYSVEDAKYIKALYTTYGEESFKKFGFNYTTLSGTSSDSTTSIEIPMSEDVSSSYHLQKGAIELSSVQNNETSDSNETQNPSDTTTPSEVQPDKTEISKDVTESTEYVDKNVYTTYSEPTVSTSSGSSGSKSSTSNILSKIATAAGLLSVSKSSHSGDSTSTTTTQSQSNQQNLPHKAITGVAELSNTKINIQTYQYKKGKLCTKDVCADKTYSETPLLANTPNYYAKVVLSNDSKDTTALKSIKGSITIDGKITRSFEPNKIFLLIADEKLDSGTHTAIIRFAIPDKSTNERTSKIAEYKTTFDVFEENTALTSKSSTSFSQTITYNSELANKTYSLKGGTIISAESDNNGTCKLLVTGGTFASDEAYSTIKDNQQINVTLDNYTCNDIKENLSITLSNLTMTENGLESHGEVVLNGKYIDSSYTDGASMTEAQLARIERIKEQLASGNIIAVDNNLWYDTTTNKWVDYTGSELSDKQKVENNVTNNTSLTINSDGTYTAVNDQGNSLTVSKFDMSKFEQYKTSILKGTDYNQDHSDGVENYLNNIQTINPITGESKSLASTITTITGDSAYDTLLADEVKDKSSNIFTKAINTVKEKINNKLGIKNKTNNANNSTSTSALKDAIGASANASTPATISEADER